MKAVVLLSGGMDSATCLAIAQSEGREVTALTIDYGQRHQLEIDRARAVTLARGIRDHRVVSLDLRLFGGSALTSDLAVPKGEEPGRNGIPPTYVPARNTIFLSLALGLAEAVSAGEIFIGVTAVDFSGYPDCRPEFIDAFERLAAVATRAAVLGAPISLRAPLLRLGKAEIVRRGLELGVDYGATLSCYDPAPAGLACGRCDACTLRRRGFVQAGVPDPTRYAP
ncbi:MAG: 7-cyano-7-deazaguanine synthase QueC [Deltaproteobacteria bacterium]